MVIMLATSIGPQFAEVEEVVLEGFAFVFVAVIRGYRRIIRLVACNCSLTALKTENVGF